MILKIALCDTKNLCGGCVEVARIHAARPRRAKQGAVLLTDTRITISNERSGNRSDLGFFAHYVTSGAARGRRRKRGGAFQDLFCCDEKSCNVVASPVTRSRALYGIAPLLTEIHSRGAVAADVEVVRIHVARPMRAKQGAVLLPDTR